MVKQDYLTGSFFLEKDDRLVPLPKLCRKFCNGAQFYLCSAKTLPQDAAQREDLEAKP